MCNTLAAGMWQSGMLLTWGHELPPARLCAVSGRPYWALMCFLTAHGYMSMLLYIGTDKLFSMMCYFLLQAAQVSCAQPTFDRLASS